MSLRIATNAQALAAQRSLMGNVNNQAKSLERLSSGTRINRAGDDAAGLAISEKLKSSVRGLKQATRNANDGISLVQTAEGAMNEVSNILIRLRELSIQSASDTIGDIERQFVDREVQQLKDEVTRIAESTEFNGTKLLNGTSPTLEIQVGLFNDQNLDRLRYDSKEQVSTLSGLGIDDITTRDKESSQQNLAKLDSALNQLNSNRSVLGALQNRLQSTINNLTVYRENLESANSRIRDTDMAEESSELVKSNILTSANISVLGQANMNPQAALKLLG